MENENMVEPENHEERYELWSRCIKNSRQTSESVHWNLSERELFLSGSCSYPSNI